VFKKYVDYLLSKYIELNKLNIIIIIGLKKEQNKKKKGTSRKLIVLNGSLIGKVKLQNLVSVFKNFEKIHR